MAKTSGVWSPKEAGDGNGSSGTFRGCQEGRTPFSSVRSSTRRVRDGVCEYTPNGYRGRTRIQIWLCRTSSQTWTSLRCTVGVKRADHREETMGTKTFHEYSFSDYPFTRTRRELEEEAGVWLPGGRFTLTCHFGAPKANRNVSSRETQTDVTIGKEERLEDYASAATKGVRQLSEDLKGLLSEGHKNYDVTLLVKGKEFRAHRCILEARSPVLGMMLTHDSQEKESGTIHIPDCDPDCFDSLLLFLYSGRTHNLDTRSALGLYYAADKYDLPLLKEQCVQFLQASLSVTSVCDVALLAARHGEEELLRTATDFFAKNIKQIILTVEWQRFMVENPTVANELLIKAL